MISQKTIGTLGVALVDFHVKYSEEDVRKVLQYAYEHREMKGRPHDLAAVLEDFAGKLRKLDQPNDPMSHWWSREGK
jgi:hypothetical protein